MGMMMVRGMMGWWMMRVMMRRRMQLLMRSGMVERRMRRWRLRMVVGTVRTVRAVVVATARGSAVVETGNRGFGSVRRVGGWRSAFRRMRGSVMAAVIHFRIAFIFASRRKSAIIVSVTTTTIGRCAR